MRTIGTQAKGIRTPIIRVNDNLVQIIVDSIEKASKEEKFTLEDKDVVAVTEAVLARAQGNYATTEQIALDVAFKLGKDEVIGIIFPILSRNRFSVLLEGIAKGMKKVYVQLSYPADEVGNQLITLDQLDDKKVNPHLDNFTEAEFRNLFGENTIHRFTGTDYIKFYKSLGDNIEIIFSNDPKYILNYTDKVICADIHSRERTKNMLKKAGAKNVIGLDDILSSSVNGSGYNPSYGLLGSNKSADDAVKLFPRDCDKFVKDLAAALKQRFNKDIEAMIYGDGAFKDPQCGIWELADPVVSPAFTQGLGGTPNELKLKYLADTQFAHLSGKELDEALKNSIETKDLDLMGKLHSQGTTPRRVVDLIGSLCDLISGSGDKGTPVVLVQGYFDNFAND